MVRGTRGRLGDGKRGHGHGHRRRRGAPLRHGHDPPPPVAGPRLQLKLRGGCHLVDDRRGRGGAVGGRVLLSRGGRRAHRLRRDSLGRLGSAVVCDGGGLRQRGFAGSPVLLLEPQQTGVLEDRTHAPAQVAVGLREEADLGLVAHGDAELLLVEGEDGHGSVCGARDERVAVGGPAQVHDGLREARLDDAHGLRAVRGPHGHLAVLRPAGDHRVGRRVLLLLGFEQRRGEPDGDHGPLVAHEVELAAPVPALQHGSGVAGLLVRVARRHRLAVGGPGEPQRERRAHGALVGLGDLGHDGPVVDAPDDAGLVVRLRGEELADGVPRDALDEGGVALERGHALARGGIPHDYEVVERARREHGIVGGPRDVDDVADVPAQRLTVHPVLHVGLVRAAELRAAGTRALLVQEHVAVRRSRSQESAVFAESHAVHRVEVIAEGGEHPRDVRIRLHLPLLERLQVPELHLLVPARGGHARSVGVAIHRKDRRSAVVLHELGLVYVHHRTRSAPFLPA